MQTAHDIYQTRVKDLHISTDAHLAGQVAQHYWYGVDKAGGQMQFIGP